MAHPLPWRDVPELDPSEGERSLTQLSSLPGTRQVGGIPSVSRTCSTWQATLHSRGSWKGAGCRDLADFRAERSDRCLRARVALPLPGHGTLARSAHTRESSGAGAMAAAI